MKKCYSLSSINLSNLISLTSLGDYFMNNCYHLTDIILPPNLRLLKSFFLKHSTANK